MRQARPTFKFNGGGQHQPRDRRSPARPRRRPRQTSHALPRHAARRASGHLHGAL